MSQKFAWRPVKTAPQSVSNPSPRWGHSSCVIDEQIILLGGYADSIYMNDMWSFNTKAMVWNLVETSGEKPKQRSNTSLHYDKVNRQIIVFGGGGANKIRYNEINVLNWDTKEWKTIKPKQGQEAPWERTYHTSQLLYPYLLVFGGEGIMDLDDLWLFNIETQKWKQIAFDLGSSRPCGRRFHSSCVIDKQMFVIAGCYGKYRPLGDIYSIDFTCLLQKGETEGLKWKEWKLDDQSLVTRWGHSSAVLQKSIYIFGGRFHNDLNDTIVFDTSTKVLKAMKILTATIPKPRRRLSLNFVGNCLVMFGGFNSDYYNDFFFLNVARVQPIFKRIQENDQNVLSLLRRTDPSEVQICSLEGTKLTCHKGILFNYFKSFGKYERFMRDIQNKQKLVDLQRFFVCLYNGYGESSLIDKYFLEVPKSINEKWMEFTKTIEVFRAEKCPEIIIPRVGHINTLKLEEYRNYMRATKLASYYNTTLKVNGKEVMCNKVFLVKGSPYFRNLFSHKFNHKYCNAFQTCLCLDELFLQILLNYLQFGFVVVPENFDYKSWIGLYDLADYLVVDNLKTIAESQIHSLITDVSLPDIMEFAEGNNIQGLGLACARIKISRQISGTKDVSATSLDSYYLSSFYSENRFEIKQEMMKSQELANKGKPCTLELMDSDKENNMENWQ